MIIQWSIAAAALLILGVLAWWASGVRFIPHDSVGIVEKLWSFKGSLGEGKILALNGEAGFQAELLRGGVHRFYFPWQYRVHRQPLVLIPEGRIGYVYARDGRALEPRQTLGRTVPSNDFQDGRLFLHRGGQRGRQQAILREGVYAINLALFVVITEERIYSGLNIERSDSSLYRRWQHELSSIGGFLPVVVGAGGPVSPVSPREEAGAEMELHENDTLATVTVHDGPPIASGEIIAPEVRPEAGHRDHAYFQDPEAFLALGGRRGKQLQVLTDGTFFINRWFATVEIRPKTLIPIGYVGVVVSYYGITGEDVTGDRFRYGEQVENGHRGVWKRILPPGKYALNPYALKVELVPTVNFVLRWITGSMETHQYDRDLKSIELITADGYEPKLPLSLVLHIDYEKAPRVVQRFGNVKKLISQTLDPILAAYFRDVAQHTPMLDLLTRREEIQKQATAEIGRRFQEYDINCVAVLIGRPESKPTAEGDPIEDLFDQLRCRRLADEQIMTYSKQQGAATKRRELKEAEATAEKQTELTQARIDVEVTANRSQAQLVEAERLAKRDVARAQGEARSKELIAQGEARAAELLGRGEAVRIGQTGMAEASVFLQKIRAYGDPRLFALAGLVERLAESRQPLVPEKVLSVGGEAQGDGAGAATGVIGQLLTLVLSEAAGFTLEGQGLEELDRFREKLLGSTGDTTA